MYFLKFQKWMLLNDWREEMKLYDPKELKDSRIFFDKYPRNYIRLLCYFFLLLLLISSIAIYFIPKNYIVRAQGSIEANDKTYVTPLANGTIVMLHKKEGDSVQLNDILITLSAGTERIQEEELQKQISFLEEKKKIFDKYEKSLNEKINSLKNVGEEQEYHGKVEYYLSQVKEDQKQDMDRGNSLADKATELANLDSEVTKIKNEQRETYQKEVARKHYSLTQASQKLEELKVRLLKEQQQNQLPTTSSDAREEENNTEVIQAKIDEVAKEIDMLTYEIEDLTTNYNKQLDEEVKAKNEEVKAKKQEIKEVEQQNKNQSHQTYTQFISELGAARTQNEEKILELSSQKMIRSGDSNILEIRAHKEGKIHYLTPVKNGSGIQAYQPVAQIDNGQKSELHVESYIAAQDISKVTKGNNVKIALQGVNQIKFGLLKGKVESIGSGTITQNTENNSQLLYQVLISLEQTSLKSNSKEEVHAVASMPIQADIIYDKETYFEWVLEQFNFTNN